MVKKEDGACWWTEKGSSTHTCDSTRISCRYEELIAEEEGMRNDGLSGSFVSGSRKSVPYQPGIPLFWYRSNP